jgi:protocatechuate 3,4-dioxygenase beta subunit
MTAILAAQTPTPTKEPPTSALEGQVVRDPGSLPVKKAEVQVIAEGQEEEGKTYTGTTDADGHFRIEGIHAGRYRAFVERLGLVEIDKRHKRSAGTALSFDPGKDISDLVLHMLSAAVVVGRVVDEDGDPMPRTDVSVLRYGYALGERHLETAASGTTNDLGEYRIPDLLPGHYLIAANPTPDFSNLAATPADKPNGQPKQEMAYVPTYYPGTTDPSQAGFLELRAGDETAVNFNLTLTPTFHVRGSVAGAQNLGSSVELVVRAKDQQSEFTATELDKDGNFDISHLAPGSYTLFVVREGHDTSLLAQQAIEISNRDIDGLRMLALGGSRVRGSVSVEGVHRIDPSRLLFFLRPSEIEKGGSFIGDLAAAQTLAPVQADGAFELKDVPAGSYSILVEGTTLLPDYYLKSAKLGSTDVLDAGLSLGGGGSYALEILIGAGAATLDGQVDRDGQPFADATVLAVPSGEHASRLQLYEKTATDQHGHFALKGLTPGDYRLFAFESIEEGVYFDPAFLKPYEGSSEIVHLAENAHKTLQLKLIPAGDDAP